MEQYPEIWKSYGDLATHARDAWIDLIAGVDLALKESLGRQVEAMRAELAGPDPSPLENLLIGRIIVSALQSDFADAAVAQAGNVSIKQADFARKRQDSASRRLLMAIATLASVRRLLSSSVEAPGTSPVTGKAGRSSRWNPGSGKRGKNELDVTDPEAEALHEFRQPGGDVDRGK
jgi:hypothetical protein